MCRGRPHFDDAVEPLPPHARGVDRERHVCDGRSERTRIGHRIRESQVERRVAAGDDAQGLPPVVRLALKHQRLI
jgi:hypothetical protein